MKKWLWYLFIFIIVFTTACSSQNKDAAKSNVSSEMDRASNEMENSVAIGDQSEQKSEAAVADKKIERKIIYKADISIRVKNYEKAQQSLETKAKKYGGFIVESEDFRHEDDQMSGTITIRIPQESFQLFLHDAEGMAEEVIERKVNGQDVTEEYIDLESRLRSKRVVEERLLEFMKRADKTEDLLKISSDLAIVQEEIEQVIGRMKFLENQSDLSTVNISLFEKNVIVPKIEKDDLNTLERTKKQFVTSANFLLTAFSGLFVFIFGNLPVFILITIFVFILFIGIKKYRSETTTESNNNSKKLDDK